MSNLNKTPKRPEFIDRYMMLHKLIKESTVEKQKLNPQVSAYVKAHPQPDFKLVPKESPKIDAEGCMKWAKRNLTKEQYRSCFVRAFDPNKFQELTDELFDKEENKELESNFLKKKLITMDSRVELHPIILK